MWLLKKNQYYIKHDEEAEVNTINSHDNDPENHAQSSWMTMETHISCHSGELSSTLDNEIKVASICMIEATPKIWPSKQENKYRVLYYSSDIDIEIFDYKVGR